MDLLVWLILGSALAWTSEWLLNRLAGPDRSYSRWAWQRVAARIGAFIIAGALTWWLLDIGGELRFVSALRSGDEALIAANRPHSLMQPNGTWFAIILVLGCLAFGLDMILRPQRQAPAFARGGNVTDSTLRKVTVYGWIIAALGLLMAVGFTAAFLAIR